MFFNFNCLLLIFYRACIDRSRSFFLKLMQQSCINMFKLLLLLSLLLLFIHSFIHSSIHSFFRSFVLLFTHPIIHPSLYSFIHSFTHSLTHLFVIDTFQPILITSSVNCSWTSSMRSSTKILLLNEEKYKTIKLYRINIIHERKNVNENYLSSQSLMNGSNNGTSFCLQC